MSETSAIQHIYKVPSSQTGCVLKPVVFGIMYWAQRHTEIECSCNKEMEEFPVFRLV
jgi:hypothetical protein